jgi:hypothetical protein
VTTFVKARWPFPPPGCGLALGALFLTSCGGGGPAPGPTAVSQTPPPAPTAVTETPPPEPTWASLSQADAIWQQITSTVTLVKPILRPAYLPPDLTEVRLNVAGWGYFGMAYEDVTHDKWIHLVVGWVGTRAPPISLTTWKIPWVMPGSCGRNPGNWARRVTQACPTWIT